MEYDISRPTQEQEQTKNVSVLKCVNKIENAK